jgi:prevent-host-death family protein
MILVNMYDAKTNLSKLVEQAVSGKEIIIAKAGKPVVKLVTYKPEKTPRIPGHLKGKIWISDDFNDESQTINNLFYSSKI